MNRQDAWQLLTEFTQSEGHIKHALAVEAAMRAYARKFGEDEEKWGIVGLIHDFDYDRFPTIPAHTTEGAKIMRERGWPEEIIRAMQSHASYSGVPRTSLMEKALVFCERAQPALLTAVALSGQAEHSRCDQNELEFKKSGKKSRLPLSDRQDVIEGCPALA